MYMFNFVQDYVYSSLLTVCNSPSDVYFKLLCEHAWALSPSLSGASGPERAFSQSDYNHMSHLLQYHKDT